MGLTADDYTQHLQRLLPPGVACTRELDSTLTDLLAGLSEELARVDGRAELLLAQIDPRITTEMLPDWEALLGLPDTCPGGVPTATEERQMAAYAKLIATGGSSKAYFLAICTALGYQAEIVVYRPFIAGRSRCGAQLNGPHSVRHTWLVRVTLPRATYFRTGLSRCGDRLAGLARAVDLECKLTRLKQAHSNLIFSYEGV